MSRLKTVWDAVNNLECGTLKPNWCNYIGYNCYHGFYFLQNNSKFSVCTIAEFSALVEEMTLGLDVNPVNHGHYLNYVDADKTLLEKETKPNYISLEFWKDAPEGAQYYKADCEKFFASWYKDITDHSYKTWVVGKSHSWTHCNYKSPCLIENMVKRPQSTPTETPEEKEALDSIVNNPLVYTQEMADNHLTPRVGCSFMVVDSIEDDSRLFDFKGKDVEVIGLSVTALNKQVITFQHPLIGIGCGVYNASWVKPIDTRTKKEKAIDELRDLDNSICNDTEWHANFLQAIIDGKITGVKWVGE